MNEAAEHQTLIPTDKKTWSGKAENTQQVYTACVADLASYYKRSPDLLTYDQVADWLFHLRDERKLASSLYKLLFDAAAQSLLDFARTRLEGTPGITAVLHT